MAVNNVGSDNVSKSLKEALFETLTAILSPSQEIRITAEEQLKILEVTEEFGIHLAELTVDPNEALAIRQLASVLLKQYVECHWSSLSEKFRPPETTESAKAVIRQVLPYGLRETISKVRSSVAYAITAVAHWDWPDSWPELFNILMQSLTCGDANAVHGAMRVLTEFSREVTDMQIPAVAPVILPEMYRIFMEPRQYSIRTRGRAVEIFCTLASTIVSMSDYNKGIAKMLLCPILPTFTEALVQGLREPDGLTSDSGLKMEILKALTVLVKNFPRQMATWLQQVLSPVWNTLTESAGIYVRTVVNGSEEADDAVDSDGEVLGFENLVFSIFEFVHGLVETPKFRGTVKKGMADLMYYIVLYMQITEDQVRTWSTNPDQFVEDEDDDTFSYSVRISAQDLLLALAEEFEDESAEGLCSAVTKHLHEAEIAKESGNPHWWKIHESCMLAVGSIKDLMVEHMQAGKLNFDLVTFMQSVVLTDLNLSVSPFLAGRCLWTASRYGMIMSTDLIQRFLQATVSGLQENQPSSVRVSAVRAVWGFCDHLKSSNNSQMIVPYLPPILEGLIAMATQFSTEVISLVLETITIVVSVDKTFTAGCESKVTPLTIAVFLKHNSDPVITSLAQDIFKELSQNEACQQPLQQRLLPTLVSILNAPTDKIPMGLQAVALDVLQTIVRSSSAPLSSNLMATFPIACQCILRTDDNSTLQSGGECLRSYVSEAADQVAQWQDEQGRNGLWYIVQVAAQLLNPRTSEFTAAFVGRLVTSLISKAGDKLGENLDLLLKAVLSKMQQAETLSVIQSLVMVFAHLIHTQMDAVLNFLSSVPGPTGKSALEFVLTEWSSRQHLFYGAYEGKVSTTALCKLLQHGVSTNDSRLADIHVKGDQIMSKDDNAVKTRSKSAACPDQWTVIPLLVKIYKLIINELSNAVESNMAKDDDCEDDEESDNGWDEDEDEVIDPGPGGDNQSCPVVSSTMSAFAPASAFPGFDQVDEDDEDPDALANPLYHINIQAYLTEFLQSFAQQPYYSVFTQHHTPQEKQVLSAVGICV